MPAGCSDPDYAPVNGGVGKQAVPLKNKDQEILLPATCKRALARPGDASALADREQRSLLLFLQKRRPFYLDAIPSTFANPTDNAPICSWSPLAPFVSPVAVPTTLNGTAVAAALLVPVSTATP